MTRDIFMQPPSFMLAKPTQHSARSIHPERSGVRDATKYGLGA